MWPCASAQLVVRGSIHCLPDGNVDFERPLTKECAVVVPISFPQYAAATSEDGVFELSMPYDKRIVDKTLFLSVWTGNREVGQYKVFIGAGNLRRNRELWIFEIPEPILVSESCRALSTDVHATFEELENRRASSTNLASGGGLLRTLAYITAGILTGLGSVASLNAPKAGAGPPGSSPPDSITTSIVGLNAVREAKASLREQFIDLYQSSGFGMGTSFAGSNRFERSPFLNAAALGSRRFPRAEFLSDFSEHGEFGGSSPLTDRLGIAASYIWLRRTQSVESVLQDNSVLAQNLPLQINLASVSLGIQGSDDFSVGMSVKYTYVEHQAISTATRTTYYSKGLPFNEYSSSPHTISRKHLDLDLSTTWHLSPAVTCGLNVINVAGEDFSTPSGQEYGSRLFGVGGTYEREDLVIGADILTGVKLTSRFALGGTYVVENKLDLNAGYEFFGRKIQAGFATNTSILRKFVTLRYAFSRSDEIGTSHLLGLAIYFAGD